MSKLRVVVVDDEEEAREGVKQLLKNDPEVELLSTCRNGLEAIQVINRSKPDLVFMDIQMPEINGFDVLNNVRVEPFPIVIFITAFDQYALKAFEIHAVDYLLKPFSNKRFFQALNFAKETFHSSANGEIDRKLSQVLKKYNSDQTQDDHGRLINENEENTRLIIKSSGKIIFLKLEDIQWIEAFDYYIKIHIDSKYYLVRESMKRMESRLPSDRFLRIHKSSIVNLDYISELEPQYNSEFILTLRNGIQLKVSRSYRKNLDFILQ